MANSKRNESKKSIAGVIVYYPPDNEILLLKKNTGEQGIPAGKVQESDVTNKRAACRELLEETGLMASDEDLIFLKRSAFKGRTLNLFVYCVGDKKPRIHINNKEHCDKIWVTPQKALEMDLICHNDIHYFLANKPDCRACA